MPRTTKTTKTPRKRPAMTAMKLWMAIATTEQQEDLAKRAGTSRAYLYHLAGGFRDASPQLARAIEEASAEIHRETRRRLPKIYRTDLNRDCRACDLAEKCLGPVAVRSEFDYVIDQG